jgi:DNA processing protein
MPLAPSALEPILRVAIVEGIGPTRLSALMKRFGSAERILAARGDELAAVDGFGRVLVGRLRAAATDEGLERARTAMAVMQKTGAVAITPDDAAYPDAFREVSDPPYLLFAVGNLDLLATEGLAVVGTRTPSNYGLRTTTDLAGTVAREGLTIVSGMARGIDAAAHAAALAAGGGTIGVLGNGIEQAYPPENARLFQKVRETGLLITEFAPGEQPNAGNFPRRNRLIAALSLAVLVVEMGDKSGARHTVDFALEQGKDVYAVPGPISSDVSAGTNRLLKDGATIVTSARDVLEGLRGVGRAFTAALAPETAHPDVPPPPPADLAPDEAAVFAALAPDARHVDDLAAASGLAPGNVLAALLGLELRDLAQSLPGKQYRLRG